MKGRSPTVAEQAFMAEVGKLPCIACEIDGVYNDYISIHHIDGRTKPGAHFLVLPLCASHHQKNDLDPAKRIAIHGDKGRFESKYGTQYELLERIKNTLKTI